MLLNKMWVKVHGLKMSLKVKGLSAVLSYCFLDTYGVLSSTFQFSHSSMLAFVKSERSDPIAVEVIDSVYIIPSFTVSQTYGNIPSFPVIYQI